MTRLRLGNRLAWPGTVHAEKGAMSQYAARSTPLGRKGGRCGSGRRGWRVTPRFGQVAPFSLVGILIVGRLHLCDICLNDLLYSRALH